MHQWSLGFFYYRQGKLILTDTWVSPYPPGEHEHEPKAATPGSVQFYDAAAAIQCWLYLLPGPSVPVPEPSGP